ncbi:MAG: peroxiredoxin [Chloroflexota bacterium]
MPTSLQPGDDAPSFALTDQSGTVRRLEDYKGKNIVLYFYPGDETPGCTTEACEFRDEHSALTAMGAVVLGISRDDEASHKAFAEHHELPFPLLVDSDGAVSEAYGVWGERERDGVKSIGMTRTTFLIGPFGRFREVWPFVRPEGHARQVKNTLAQIEAQDAFSNPE